MNSCRSIAAAIGVAAILLIVLSAVGTAQAQSLTVVPVNVQLPPGQRAATLTVNNAGSTATAVQIRVFVWSQQDGKDQLTATNDVLASPPVATIAPGDSQVVRLVLRQTPQGREATYRILLDQIPPPAEPGILHVVLRLSIPIFAQPAARALPHVQFHMERHADRVFLVGVNDGLRHEAIRDIALSSADGQTLKPVAGELPYILAGSTRRWAIAPQGALPLTNETLRLTAQADAGKIEQQIRVVEAP